MFDHWYRDFHFVYSKGSAHVGRYGCVEIYNFVNNDYKILVYFKPKDRIELLDFVDRYDVGSRMYRLELILLL